MAKYIEREAALKTLEKSLLFCESELETGEYRKGCIAAIQDDIGNIKHLPTADVVEVVRCKDCQHARQTVYGNYHCLVDHRLAHEETDYCSYGERKEGE